jgi:REP element-mobilizing transposase RayT
MPSPPAIQKGFYYHIYNRGVNRQSIFLEERNYSYFLELYYKYIPTVAKTYAYCLLNNHFHLLVYIKSDLEQQSDYFQVSDKKFGFEPKNPSQQFANLFNAYAKAINKVYDRTGSLFQNPFNRIQVSSNKHLVHLVRYIHLNPQRHTLIDDFRLWPYSSYQELISPETSHLEQEVVFSWFGGSNGFIEHHQDESEVHQIKYLIVEDDN